MARRKKSKDRMGIFVPFVPPPPGAPSPEDIPPRITRPPTPAPFPVAKPTPVRPDIWERIWGVPAGTPPPPAPTAPKPTVPPAWIRPAVDPAQYFDLNGLFNHVKGLRQAPNWTRPAMVPLLQIARPTRDPLQAALEAGRLFRIPDAEISRHGQNAWQYVIDPFVKQLEQALNLAKPGELPGLFRFEFAGDGSFGLGYYEQ